MNFREIYEKRELEILGPLGAPSSGSKGRERTEPFCEFRTEFQRDRDRIIHSKAFRRLSHKTQVFISPARDHFRTRMTHTLEVAQIGRTLARVLGLNEDLTEAVALGHDLGHTPFGHAGEEALNQIWLDHGFQQGFTHARQSLRVVDCLEREGRGLNLTFEVRDGIRWHSKGMGPLFTDEAQRMPATTEGCLIRIVDRVAYINHDIDDALRAGILKDNEMPRFIKKDLGADTSQRLDTIVADIARFTTENNEPGLSAAVQEALEAAKDFLWDRVYTAPEAREEQDRARRMLNEIFGFFEENPSRLPQGYGADVEPGSIEALTAVSDYIAGMTDRFAIETYKDLFFPGNWIE